MPREATLPPRVVNVPGDYFSMAGFEVTLYGRFWVTPEGCANAILRCCLDLSLIARSKNDVTKVRHDYVTTDLRIAPKDVKSFLCNTFKPSAHA
jgi:hypothetical protein